MFFPQSPPNSSLAQGQIEALCVDLSLTMTGWALVRLPLEQEDRSGIFKDPVVTCGDIKLTNAKTPLAERIGTLCKLLDEAASREGVALVAMETPQHTYAGTRRSYVTAPTYGVAEVEKSGKGQHAIAVQQRVFGAAIQWITHHTGQRVLEVDPMHSKRALTTQHNAGKNLVHARLAQLFTGFTDGKLPPHWSEGIRDALAVAYYLDGELSRFRLGAPSALDAFKDEADAPQDDHPGPGRPERQATDGRRPPSRRRKAAP